jgi:hypothetical protein
MEITKWLQNRLETSLGILSTPQSGERQNCCETNDFGNLSALELSLFALFGPILGTVFQNGRTVSIICG